MKIEDIERRVRGLPHMNVRQARTMTEVIVDNRFRDVLELGFRHGVSTCYIAGALDEIGGGRLTTVDLETARRETPAVEDLLQGLGLREMVTVFYEPTSYVWRLMRLLEADPQPRFDLCYIDGAHTWFTDGFAFFLVDRLLRPGGLIIFDDLDWTYASSPSLAGATRVRSMPADERTTPQIRQVYELLVKPHPAYTGFVEKDGWAYARKAPTEGGQAATTIRREVVHERTYVGLGAALLKVLKKIAR